MKSNHAKRLGVGKTGITNIQKHRWFSGFDWDGLASQRLPSPIKPVISGNDDVSYFDFYEEDDLSSIPECSWYPDAF